MIQRKVHEVSVRMEAALRAKRLRGDTGPMDEPSLHFPPLLPDNPLNEQAFYEEMAEFERQIEAQKMVTVYERIGCPMVVPPDALKQQDIQPALDELIDCFIAHNICIDFFGDYTPAELYRAIVEDLLSEEIVEVTAPGWVSHIVHTTPENQIKHDVEWFVNSVMCKVGDDLLGEHPVHRPRCGSDGLIQTREAFERDLAELWSRLGPVQFVDIKVTEVGIMGSKATAKASVHWHTEAIGGCGFIQSDFRLEEMPEICWDVIESSFVTDMLRYL